MTELSSRASTQTASAKGKLGRILGEETAKLVGLFLVVQVVAILSHYLLTRLIHLNWWEAVLSFFAMLSIVAIAVFAGGYTAKVRLIDELNETLGSKIADFDKAIDLRTAELDSLLETCRQLKEIMKEGRNWLVDDEMVLAIEKPTDSEILVIVPDFFYESQSKYLRVIVENLKRADGPTYRYVVHGGNETQTQWQDLRRTLKKELAAAGVRAPESVLDERFRVTLVPEGKYPDAALYGCAIYQNKDGTTKCLQYLPREIGSMNINIPVGSGGLGERLVLRLRAHLDALGRENR